MRRTVTRAVSLALTGLVLAAGWLFLAPPELGGATRYAIIEGSSMEPLLHAGDLAVVRADRDVAVGDAVLYRDEVLGVNVLHRIERREGHAYVMQGDANDFLDASRPTKADVRGELWFSVPYAGTAIVWVRQPLHAALGVFVLALLFLAGGGSTREGLRERPLES
jgi:signal peptidase